MRRARKALPGRVLESDYPAWKSAAGKVLKDRHDIDGALVADRIWMQFYVRGLNPKDAAEQAEMVYRTTRLPGPRGAKEK